jgi:hypothetical protein
MARAFFLSQKYLVNNTPITVNVDMSEIYPFAKTAEDMYIQGTIGTKLYDDLINKLDLQDDSPPTLLSTNDRTLCNNIRDALIWYTFYDAAPFIRTKVRNIGVVKQNGDNLETIDDNAFAVWRNEIKIKADFYLNKVKLYLCEYDSLYSEFKCDSWYMNPNLITSSSCGIAFDRSTRADIDYKFIKKWFNS